MYQPYLDIRQTMGEPIWHDENGVPRYCEMHPSNCADIYADVVLFFQVQCQSCDERFWVCTSGQKFDPRRGGNRTRAYWSDDQWVAELAVWGDAPWHGESQCAGTTMCAETPLGLEFVFWRKPGIPGVFRSPRTGCIAEAGIAWSELAVKKGSGPDA